MERSKKMETMDVIIGLNKRSSRAEIEIRFCCSATAGHFHIKFLPNADHQHIKKSLFSE